MSDLTPAPLLKKKERGYSLIGILIFYKGDARNTHEAINISSQVAGNVFWVRFRSVQPSWDYWWVIDNVRIRKWNATPVPATIVVAEEGFYNTSTNKLNLRGIPSEYI